MDSIELSSTPEYAKTYVNTLLGTLLEIVQTSTDAKTRAIILDSICRQQKQQIDTLNDTVSQLTNGLQATSTEYQNLDANCSAAIAQLTDELNNAKSEIDLRLGEVKILSPYEEKYKLTVRKLETVQNNYNATKAAYDELTVKYNELLKKQKGSVDLNKESTKPSRKKQSSEDTGWS